MAAGATPPEKKAAADNLIDLGEQFSPGPARPSKTHRRTNRVTLSVGSLIVVTRRKTTERIPFYAGSKRK